MDCLSNKIDNYYIFCSTKEHSDIYSSNIFGNTDIYEKCSDDIIKNILDLQIKRCDNGENKKILLIIESCHLANRKYKNNKIFNELLLNARHYNISLIFIKQHYDMSDRIVRNNIDYLFLCNNNSISEKKRLYDNCGGFFPSYKLFNSSFDELTSNNNIMIIDNINDKVFYITKDDILNININTNNNYSIIHHKNDDVNEDYDFNLSKKTIDEFVKIDSEIDMNDKNIDKYDVLLEISRCNELIIKKLEDSKLDLKRYELLNRLAKYNAHIIKLL